MANKGLMHVKKTMKTMKAKGTYKKGEGLKQVIKAAKATYYKHKGGADGDDEEEVKEVNKEEEKSEGGRRRRTRRRSRKSMY